MRGRVLVVLVACAIAATACTEPGAEPVCTRCAQLTADIDSFLGDYLDAIAARDTVRLRTMYVADDRFTWVERGTVQYRSIDAVFAGLAELPDSMPIRTEFEDLEATGVGSTGAVAHMTFRTAIGEGVGAFSFGGLMTIVFERGAGQWRIVTGHVTTVE